MDLGQTSLRPEAPDAISTDTCVGTDRRLLLAVGTHCSRTAIDYCTHAAVAGSGIWYAVHVETPSSSARDEQCAGEALSFASAAGANVAIVPASDLVEGLAAHASDLAITDLVIGHSRGGSWLTRRDMATRIAERCPELVIHLLPWSDHEGPEPNNLASTPAELADAAEARPRKRSYLYCAALVLVTALLAEPVRLIGGVRSLDLLFLLPVITAAVGFGTSQGIVAALLSVLVYDLLFAHSGAAFARTAAQSLLMTAILTGVALYTGLLANRLRARARLSDRSARENAAVVSFAQELAKAADWESTAQIVCREVSALLDVKSALIRECEGALTVEAAIPVPPKFGPIDRAAMEWAWQQGSEAGLATSHVAAADWQFHPLVTSIGILAMLAIARDDGRNPVPASKAVLLSTLIAQAALAHERLRLEDRSRTTD